jgi:hypothetical protein
MKTSESLNAATPGRVFNSPDYWAPQLLKYGDPLVSFHNGEARFLIPEAMAGWGRLIASGSAHVVLTAIRENTETGQAALQWSCEDEHSVHSRLVVDQEDIHGFDQIPKEDDFELTVSLWIKHECGPVLHQRFPVCVQWKDELLPVGSDCGSWQ